MPFISLESMFKTIAEQQAQIMELSKRITQLEAMQEKRNTEMLAQELEDMVSRYPEKLKNPIIASIDIH